MALEKTVATDSNEERSVASPSRRNDGKVGNDTNAENRRKYANDMKYRNDTNAENRRRGRNGDDDNNMTPMFAAQLARRRDRPAGTLAVSERRQTRPAG